MKENRPGNLLNDFHALEETHNFKHPEHLHDAQDTLVTGGVDVFSLFQAHLNTSHSILRICDSILDLPFPYFPNIYLITVAAASLFQRQWDCTRYTARSMKDHGMLVMQSNQKPLTVVRYRVTMTRSSSQ